MKEPTKRLNVGAMIKYLFYAIVTIQTFWGIVRFDYSEMVLGIAIALFFILFVGIIQTKQIVFVPAVVYTKDSEYVFVTDNFELHIPWDHDSIIALPNNNKLIYYKNSYVYGKIKLNKDSCSSNDF